MLHLGNISKGMFVCVATHVVVRNSDVMADNVWSWCIQASCHSCRIR